MNSMEIALLVITALTLTSCRAQEPLPEATSPLPATPTPTLPPPTVTQTPIPFATPIPPTPTATVPPILAEYLSNPRVLSVDPMDSPSGWNLHSGSVADGVLELVGDMNWNGLIRRGVAPEGTGVLIDFWYTMNPEFEILLDHGEWDTDAYRRFGVYVLSYPKTNLWQGRNSWWSNLVGNFQPEPETWYTLAMVVGDDGEFLAVIWDPQDSSKRIAYHEQIGRDWSDLGWTFKLGANVGTARFDNFARIAFDSIN